MDPHRSPQIHDSSAPSPGPSSLSRRNLLRLDFGPRSTPPTDWLRVHRPAMACRFEIVLDSPAHVPAARLALDEADRLEGALTVFRDTSELMRINHHAARMPVRPDGEVFELLRRCGEVCDDTGGAFDITSTPLSRCWGFLRRDGRLPSAPELESARALVGMDRVWMDPTTSTLQ